VHLLEAKETFKEVVLAITPITLLVILLQFTVGNLPSHVFLNFIGGVFLVILGLLLFLLGVKSALLFIGESIGSHIVQKGKIWLILLGGFVIGFVVTLAEPDVQVLSSNVDQTSGGSINKYTLLISVALGVAIFLSLALFRIVYRIPIIVLLLGGYGLVFLLAFFTSPQFIPVSFDAGGVTTGPMTVPFILSLGVGVASVRGQKGNSSNDSFGLVGLASIGPILAVLIMGVFLK
jgi:hypothetical protein